MSAAMLRSITEVSSALAARFAQPSAPPGENSLLMPVSIAAVEYEPAASANTLAAGGAEVTLSTAATVLAASPSWPRARISFDL